MAAFGEDEQYKTQKVEMFQDFLVDNGIYHTYHH